MPPVMEFLGGAAMPGPVVGSREIGPGRMTEGDFTAFSRRSC